MRQLNQQKKVVLKQAVQNSDVEENIDALIAKELAKREAETEELNKKKKEAAAKSR